MFVVTLLNPYFAITIYIVTLLETIILHQKEIFPSLHFHSNHLIYCQGFRHLPCQLIPVYFQYSIIPHLQCLILMNVSHSLPPLRLLSPPIRPTIMKLHYPHLLYYGILKLNWYLLFRCVVFQIIFQVSLYFIALNAVFLIPYTVSSSPFLLEYHF